MKQKLILSGALSVAVMLTGCGNDGDGSMPSEGNAARAYFSAAISGSNAARAYDTSWEAGDAIGISGTSGEEAYVNVSYTTTAGDGTFAVTTPGEEIYYQDDNAVTFTAYHPWNDLQGVGAITADTRAQASQKAFDYLWAQAPGSKATPQVSFSFAHSMAKLVLTIRRGADVSYQEVQDAILSLTGFKNNGTFDVTDGTAVATGGALSDWTFAGNTAEEGYNAPSTADPTAGTVSYTLILFPQELAAPLPVTATLEGRQEFSATLDFTAANTSAGDADAKNEWKAGRQYNLSVTLHKTALTVVGCTIEPWDEAAGGNVDAD